jgi:uncharacterized protein (DUF305 family)
VTTEATNEGAPKSRSALVALGLIVALLVGIAAGFLVKDRFSGDDEGPNAVDVGFAQDMAVHHAQAVEMAAIAIAGSTDQDIRSIAWDIATSQSNQIGQMQFMLTEWGKPLFATGGYMTWMPMSDHEMAGHDMSGMEAMPMTAMPGMATPEQLEQLRAAEGKDLDVLFLKLMITHHKGGAPMAEYAEQHANLGAIRNLASSMVKTQGYEVDLMTKLLEGRQN